jgi:hypothetical protein
MSKTMDQLQKEPPEFRQLILERLADHGGHTFMSAPDSLIRQVLRELLEEMQEPQSGAEPC